jgi:hypothetical protein
MLNWKSIQHLNSFQKLFQYVELENYTFLEIVSCYFLRSICDLPNFKLFLAQLENYTFLEISKSFKFFTTKIMFKVYKCPKELFLFVHIYRNESVIFDM